MKTLRLSLLLLLMAGSFWSCTDHRGTPAAPQRLRLKATDNSIPQAGILASYQGRTEYNYDQMGRLMSVFRPGVSRAVFTYDGQGRVLKYDNKSEVSPTLHRIAFTYSPISYAPNFNGVLFNTYGSNTGIIDEDLLRPAGSGGLSFDSDARIVNASTGVGVSLNSDNFQYSGNNIVSVRSFAGRTQFDNSYEFDDKINPYNNLITPEFGDELNRIYPAEIIRRVNRNNVTKGTFTTNGTVTNYEYDYNAQGLPTKARVTGQPGELVFTYEAY